MTCECSGNCNELFEYPTEFVAGELVTSSQNALSSVISSLTSVACSVLLQSKVRDAAANKLEELIGKIDYKDFI